MKAFLCECKKTKEKLMAVMLPTILFLLFWMLWQFSYMDEDETSFYYTYFTQGLLVMNTIFLPIMIAVMASRLMDMETKGNTYKLLCTLMPKTRIFTCKVALAALYLLGFFVLQTAGLFLAGTLYGVTEPFPAVSYLQMEGTGFLTCLLLFLLQIFLSLRFENQLYPLLFGLIGSFVGLFSMFLPMNSPLLYFLPWAYFLLGASSQMLFDENTLQISFLPLPFHTAKFCILLIALCLGYISVRLYFLRKDV